MSRARLDASPLNCASTFEWLEKCANPFTRETCDLIRREIPDDLLQLALRSLAQRPIASLEIEHATNKRRRVEAPGALMHMALRSAPESGEKAALGACSPQNKETVDSLHSDGMLSSRVLASRPEPIGTSLVHETAPIAMECEPKTSTCVSAETRIREPLVSSHTPATPQPHARTNGTNNGICATRRITQTQYYDEEEEDRDGDGDGEEGAHHEEDDAGDGGNDEDEDLDEYGDATTPASATLGGRPLIDVEDARKLQRLFERIGQRPEMPRSADLRLPCAVWCHALTWCDTPTMMRVYKVCRMLRRLASNPASWDVAQIKSKSALDTLARLCPLVPPSLKRVQINGSTFSALLKSQSAWMAAAATSSRAAASRRGRPGCAGGGAGFSCQVRTRQTWSSVRSMRLHLDTHVPQKLSLARGMPNHVWRSFPALQSLVLLYEGNLEHPGLEMGQLMRDVAGLRHLDVRNYSRALEFCADSKHPCDLHVPPTLVSLRLVDCSLEGVLRFGASTGETRRWTDANSARLEAGTQHVALLGASRGPTGNGDARVQDLEAEVSAHPANLAPPPPPETRAVCALQTLRIEGARPMDSIAAVCMCDATNLGVLVNLTHLHLSVGFLTRDSLLALKNAPLRVLRLAHHTVDLSAPPLDSLPASRSLSPRVGLETRVPVATNTMGATCAGHGAGNRREEEDAEAEGNAEETRETHQKEVAMAAADRGAWPELHAFRNLQELEPLGCPFNLYDAQFLVAHGARLRILDLSSAHQAACDYVWNLLADEFRSTSSASSSSSNSSSSSFQPLWPALSELAMRAPPGAWLGEAHNATTSRRRRANAVFWAHQRLRARQQRNEEYRGEAVNGPCCKCANGACKNCACARAKRACSWRCHRTPQEAQSGTFGSNCNCLNLSADDREVLQRTLADLRESIPYDEPEGRSESNLPLAHPTSRKSPRRSLTPEQDCVDGVEEDRIKGEHKSGAELSDEDATRGAQCSPTRIAFTHQDAESPGRSPLKRTHSNSASQPHKRVRAQSPLSLAQLGVPTGHSSPIRDRGNEERFRQMNLPCIRRACAPCIRQTNPSCIPRIDLPWFARGSQDPGAHQALEHVPDSVTRSLVLSGDACSAATKQTTHTTAPSPSLPSEAGRLLQPLRDSRHTRSRSPGETPGAQLHACDSVRDRSLLPEETTARELRRSKTPSPPLNEHTLLNLSHFGCRARPASPPIPPPLSHASSLACNTSSSSENIPVSVAARLQQAPLGGPFRAMEGSPRLSTTHAPIL